MRDMPSALALRALVFGLAFLSFACLLGQFFGYWSMRVFGCCVLPPATVFLAAIAWRTRCQPRRELQSPFTWIVQGSIGGLIAAVAYDLYRLPFVLNGAPLFKVFPKFGEFLLGSTEPAWLVQLLGWSYHFSNGAALGIMFLTMVPQANRRVLFWGALCWALFVEAMLLITPYTSFLGLALDRRFIFLTATAHAIFGVTLGLWCQWRVGWGQAATVQA
jgi:hypothetical protein